MTNLGGLTSIYTTMYTTVTGGYGSGPVTIPSGPAAGTYTNINFAFIGETPSGNISGGPGLLPVSRSEASSVVAGDPADVAKLNANTTAITNQLLTEKTNQRKATLDFANLTPNSTTSIYSLTMSLPSYGQDTTKNGTAQFIQSVANTQVLAGQAIIATMRQGQTNISTSAISTNANVPYTPATPPPQATLLPAQYPYPQPVKN